MELNKEEKALIKRLKNQETTAYEEMLSTYSKTLYCLVYHILKGIGSKEDMEECVADAYVQAWLSIDQYSSDKGSLRTWLLGLAKYKALTCKRQKLRIKTVEMKEEVLQEQKDTEEIYLLREDQERVITTIKTFKPLDRQIFIRRYFYGEDIEELAKELDLTRAAIDNRLLRGRKRLKEVLGHG